MSKINEKNSNKIKNFKKINHKSGKKKDLCKKYFYKLNLSPKKGNIFQLMENGLANQDELDQVNNACTNALNSKNLLEKKQIECLKSMILHHKQIPERWIIQNNYKDLLNKVMSDPIVLAYAIVSKDIFKKRSTSISIDSIEVEKNMKSNISAPKFISYINPYSRNYTDSIEKHKLMREYCYNIKNKKYRVEQNAKNIKALNITENGNDKNNDNKKKFYLNTEATKEYMLPCIYPNKKNNTKKKVEKDETLMMTSLYYDESKLKKDINSNKDNINNENNKINNEINIEKDNKKEKIELPMIE